jgi:hypothetical protein
MNTVKNQTALIPIIAAVVVATFSGAVAAGKQRHDLSETMRESIVYLKTSYYGYDHGQPWKHEALSENWTCACAVGDCEVITTAWRAKDLAFAKALRYGQNEFIGATVQIVDYESDLCLIKLNADEKDKPLRPLVFAEDYEKGAEVRSYWLSSDNRVHDGRGYLDRARVEKTSTSYEKRLQYLIANTSHRTSRAEVYCIGSAPIGIACWSNDEKEAGLVPGEAINRFLQAVAEGNYQGFGAVGFATSELLDPVTRDFLKMPASVKNGVYVTDVYTLGTGCDVLKRDDVILAIDGHALDSHGRFAHPQYGRLSFEYLVTSKTAGDTVRFKLWRDAEEIGVRADVRGVKAPEMLVPYHEYDRQPEYVITGGFILQKLTRPYLARFGKDWAGKVSPHLYHYYRDFSFKPTAERSDIVILSHVLPARINIGYTDIGHLVVKRFNSMAIRSIADIPAAQKLNPQAESDVIEFELDNPAVVLPREELPAADMFIRRNYGIDKLSNVNQ